MARFVQVVVGPPGSGKTTYCNGMKQFMTQLGRTVNVINLDPANDDLPYTHSASIRELITLSDAMDNLSLGPNGALVYCMEYLAKNITWLQDKMKPDSSCNYYLLDCPGQVELYTHNTSMKNIVKALEKCHFKVFTVNLVDSQHCNDPGKFLAIVLTSLSTMVTLETPHVNVLAKADLMSTLAPLPFGLDYYTDVLDLDYLLEHMSSDPFYSRYSKLNRAISELITDYSLVSFIPLNIQAKQSVLEVMRAVDKACGYMYTSNELDTTSGLMSSVYSADYEQLRFASVREELLKEDIITADSNITT